MAEISLKGLDKAKVLAALFKHALPRDPDHPEPDLSVAEARRLLKEDTGFDYLRDRILKVNLAGDSLDPWGYDRDNGSGAAQRAIDSIR